MAASGYTPISLYYSSTAAATPTAGNLVNGELAINITDGKLYYKDNTGTVKVIAGTGGTGVVAGSNTQVQYNNNGVFGASSNFTFDGTNIGLAGGTANGVAYLNGSKVLTTGSGLVFDGTNLGVGTSSPAVKLDVIGPTGSVTAPTYLNQTAFSIRNNFHTRMALVNADSGTYSSEISSYSAGEAYPRQTLSFGSGQVLRYLNGSGAAAPTEKLTLDSSGNLGLGVTPSAWNGYTCFQISGNSATYSNGNNEIGFVQNAYYQSGWKYGATGIPASWNVQYLGAHQWHTAPSGTAGNAISFTQAMTLDASGNLGIGTTSLTAKLNVVGTPDATFNSQILIGNGGGAAQKIAFNPAISSAIAGLPDGALAFYGNGANTERMRIDSSGNVGIGTSSPGSFATGLVVTGGATSIPTTNQSVSASVVGGYGTVGNISSAIYGSTRGILLLGGNFTGSTDVDVGSIKFLYGPKSTTEENSASIASIAALNTTTSSTSGGVLSFRTSPTSSTPTERMRIDSNGNLLVGTTTARALITSASNASTGFSGLDIVNLSTAAVSTKFSRLAFSGTDTVGTWKPTAYINSEQIAADINYVNSSLTFYTRFADSIGERMRISPEGRLGIGTNGPSYKLDVSEDGTSASTVDVARFYANASATAESKILFGTLANVVSAGIGAQTSSATDGILKFYTEGSGTLAERMRIDPGGMVTIAYQPAFMAFVTTGTYTSGTFPGTLISSTVPTQRSSGYSGGTYTAPVSGLYQFNFVIYDFNATVFTVAVYRNGTIYTTPGGDVYQYITVAQNMNTWSFTMYLSANDYIQMGIRGTTNAYVYGGHSVWSGYLVS